MPGYVVEFGGKFCEWSTVTDAPTTYLMTEDELFEEFRRGQPDLDREAFGYRMERARKFGCSGALYGYTKASILACNRAGPNESHVATEDEMVRLYTRREPGA